MATTYTQDLLDRATAYVEQPLTARRYDEGLSTITALYSEITGEPASKCRQCQYSNYLAVVQAYIRQATRELHPETMEDSKYTLAPGVQNETFVHESYGKAVTAENLTDADAEFFISKGFKDAFILKSGEKAAAGAEGEKPKADAKAAERETKLKADLGTEKEAHKATKEDLKSEKKAVAALTKERDELNRQLTEANDKLAQAQPEPSTPPAPVVDPATQA